MIKLKSARKEITTVRLAGDIEAINALTDKVNELKKEK